MEKKTNLTLCISAGQDINGNGLSLWLVFDAMGFVDRVFDDLSLFKAAGYLTPITMIRVTRKEYREYKRLAKEQGAN